MAILKDLKSEAAYKAHIAELEAKLAAAEAKATAGSGPLSVTLSDYKGSPTLSFTGGNIKPFFIGISKAKSVLALSNTVKELVAQGEAIKAAKKAG